MSKKRFDKIYVEITNMCNLNCSFCHKTKRNMLHMLPDEFRNVVEKIKDYTDLILLHVAGEPLLSPYLEEILDICEKENMKVNITTNGTLIKEKIDILKNAKAVGQINISMHSYMENKNKNTDYLKNTIETIKEISKNSDKYISYRLWNLEDIKENSINTEVLEVLGEEYNFPNLKEKAKTEEYIKLDKMVFLNQDTKFEWPDIEKKQIKKNGKCYGLRTHVGILGNGDVVPCCMDIEGDIVLGNIHKETLEEILNKELAKKMITGFQNNKIVHKLCGTCGFM